MATASLPAAERRSGLGLLLNLVLPLVLLVALLTALGFGLYYGIAYCVLANEVSATQETQFVLRRLDLPIQFPAGAAFSLGALGVSWPVLLGVFLAVTLAYVGFKYLRNGRGTGWPRANFFAAARLLGFATCFFLLVYWKEAMDLGSQAFG